MEELSHQHAVQAINPLFGQIGHFFVITAFVCSLFAAFYYFRSTRNQQKIIQDNAHKIARLFFIGHIISIIAVVITLFIMIFNHHFEYYYVFLGRTGGKLSVVEFLACGVRYCNYAESR